MDDVTLRFDASSRRWECGVDRAAEWDRLEQPTDLLQIGRAADGRAIGFVLDADPQDAAFAPSLEAVAAWFGQRVAEAVRVLPDRDTQVSVTRDGASLPARTAPTGEVMRRAVRLHAASSDPVVHDDPSAGVVTVTLTVPWWARWARPWVAVRRRGRSDILLTGPLRVRGRTASAVLRYGMPYPGSALAADVVKGPRGASWRRRLVATAAVVILVVSAVVASRVVSDNGSSSTTGPIGWSVPSDGFIFERIVLQDGATCLGGGDRFTVVGRGFIKGASDFGLYLAKWDDFFAPIPQDRLVPVTNEIVSETEIAAVAPAADAFPVRPEAGDVLFMYLVVNRNSPSQYANTSVEWCGER